MTSYLRPNYSQSNYSPDAYQTAGYLQDQQYMYLGDPYKTIWPTSYKWPTGYVADVQYPNINFGLHPKRIFQMNTDGSTTYRNDRRDCQNQRCRPECRCGPNCVCGLGNL